MKRYITLLFLTIFTGIVYAQTADDALRYSQQHYTGTARSMAMGGAFGALGGDFSSIGINPAGLGVYQSSEFTFTPTMEMRKSTSGNLDDEKFTFGISNIGYVGTIRPRMKSNGGWQNFNFGIGYNRLNNFRKSSLSKVDNSPSSMLDIFKANADGFSKNQLKAKYPTVEYLAYETYLLNPSDDDPTIYELPIPPTERLNQRKSIEEKGHMSEFNIAFGANYAHKFYIGASLGIQNISYKSTARFTESSFSNSDFNNYYLEEYVKTSGIGANFKIGMIYKPNQNIRLGASLHTPTFFSMEDEFQNEIASHFKTAIDGHSNYKAESLLSTYEYNYRTPMKATLSGAVVLAKKMIISVDYEFVDYSNAKFKDNDYPDEFTTTNDIIKSSYESVGNLRAGLEYRVSSALSLRGGFANFGNPYKASSIDESYNIYSTGFGIRQGNFFFDAAYSYSDRDESYLYYDADFGNGNTITSDLVKLEDKNHQMRLTFGFKF